MEEREGQSSESSLPRVLHPFLKTSPQSSRPGSSSSSQMGREQRILEDVQLAPLQHSARAAVDIGDQRTSRAYLPRGTDSQNPSDTFGGAYQLAAGPSHGDRELPSFARAVTSTVSASDQRAHTEPVNQRPAYMQERIIPWQEGGAGPSSLSRSQPGQSHPSGRNEQKKWHGIPGFSRRETKQPAAGSSSISHGKSRLGMGLSSEGSLPSAPAGNRNLPYKGTVFVDMPPYAYMNTAYDAPPAETTTFRQEGQAGLLSHAPSQPGQAHQSQKRFTQTEIPTRHRIESSPLGSRISEWEAGRAERTHRTDARRAHASDWPEVGSREREDSMSVNCAFVSI